jgi:hypothetical protein
LAKAKPDIEMSELTNGAKKAAELKGLGGWLILVAIGVVLSPMNIVRESFATFEPLFRDNTFADISDPSSPSFVNYLTEYVYAALLINTLFVVWAILNVVWFFTKNAKFPRSFRYFLLSALTAMIGDIALSTNFTSFEEAFDATAKKDIFKSCINAAIWVPYTMVSKRVKNTFVN